MIASTNAPCVAAGSTNAPFVSAGMFKVLTTPRNSAPEPIGTFKGTQAVPNDVLDVSPAPGKSMLSRVHLADDDHPAQPRLAGLFETRAAC